MSRQIHLIPVMALALKFSAAVGAENPNTTPTPEGAHLQQVADDLILDGLHSSILRFDMAGSAEDVLKFYRQRFGPRHVENSVGGDCTIAAEENGFFITVRIQPALDGRVVATLISTRVGGGRSRSRVSADTEALLPAGSGVFQSQESVDAGSPAVLLMAVNKQGLHANHDALVEGFQVRGFHVMTDTTAQVRGHQAISLTLSSPTEDATASIVDAGNYRTLLLQRSRKPQ